MPQHPIETALPRNVREELQALYERVQVKYGAQLLWERQLTMEQKRRLGDNFETAYCRGGTVGMWMRLHGVTKDRAVLDLARSLYLIEENTHRWLLRETGECSDDSEEDLKVALERADLVLTEQPRAVYWKGEELDVPWERHPALWEYFLTLCERAKQSRGVDAADFGDHNKPDNHIKLKSRIKKQVGFPKELGERIRSYRGGAQKLDVTPLQICIIQGER
jgi:hypothetical protein